MSGLSRADTSLFGRWWWTVDRWSLAALGTLVVTGAILTLAASPAVAERIGLESFHFARRQFAYLVLAAALLVAVSLLEAREVRRLGVVVFAVALVLTVATLAAGHEIKGAQRWLSLGGVSLQPSEFLKPAFAVVAAWMFAEQHRGAGIPGNAVATALYLAVAGLLFLQPDIGMALVVTAVWLAQFFLAGLRLVWVGVAGALSLAGVVAAYFVFPHVANRIDRFLDPASGDSYQITVALQSFASGGWIGRGPGEGRVKTLLPDAHSDFVFAVAGEEFGLVACLAILALFAFVVLRGFARLLAEENLFVLLAGAGLLTQFGLQAVVNMASTLRLMPTKGMTLPFVSYGGSSVLALALGMGMVLALTRRRAGGGGRL
ncbi:MAG: cell division protein FtsW [Proteobacteria bacterium]|nr:cell division protein FtsW [Pseudomonadota bacterium]